ncbi:hypothetical protein LC724_04630 [Blautia sp. RD014234]|nr:hypothetical protein [Blautia parvula]
MKTVIMNFSGVYPEEDFYRQKAGDYEMVDFTHAEGVNCYCTSEAEQEIKERIRAYGPCGIHFLDSGNYHYLSKFWMEMIDTPFPFFFLTITQTCRNPHSLAFCPAEAG